jgi:Transposase DDE domain
MSDNLKRYRAISAGLKQFFPRSLTPRQGQHFQVLAAMINGIVGSRKVQLAAVADKLPSWAQRESRIKRFTRWLQNDEIRLDSYFAPFAEALLAGLAGQPLVLVIDGSQVGQGCQCLMLSVVYRKRALPLGWIVFASKKGHSSEARHLELVRQVQPLLPDGAQVMVLGDGEFDGVDWLHQLEAWGWFYVCRTAQNAILWEDGYRFSFAEWGATNGACHSLAGVTFTDACYGPLMAIAWWRTGCQEPIYLVSNMELADEACHYYQQRFTIETFFSDQKSRGFHLHKSHLRDPERLARLLIAACLAYIWVIYLGVQAQADAIRRLIHRVDRCDLSLFQLGLALLEHWLNHDQPIQVAFAMPPPLTH